jgi:hypothetical protein
MGNVCRVGGLWGMLGRDEEKLREGKLMPEMFKRWEDCPKTVAKVKGYAVTLAEL